MMYNRLCVGALALLILAIGGINMTISPVCQSIITGSPLGYGGFGTVFAAFRKDQCYTQYGRYVIPKNSLPAYVAKTFEGDNAEKNSLAEYNILLRLNRAFYSLSNGAGTRRFSAVYGKCMCGPHTCIITNFIRNDLTSNTRSMSREIVALHGLVAAVQQIHSLGFVHLDLKPENVRIGQDGVVRLIDFGMSEQLSPHKPPSVVPGGTIVYMAPEVLRNAPISYYQRSKVDTWGVGMIAYEMVMHKSFHDSTFSDAVRYCIQKRLGKSYAKNTQTQMKIIYLQTKIALYERGSIQAERVFFNPNSYDQKVAMMCFKLYNKVQTNLRATVMLNIRRRFIEEGVSANGSIITQITSLIFDKLLKFFPENREAIDNVYRESRRLSGSVSHRSAMKMHNMY